MLKYKLKFKKTNIYFCIFCTFQVRTNLEACHLTFLSSDFHIVTFPQKMMGLLNRIGDSLKVVEEVSDGDRAGGLLRSVTGTGLVDYSGQ